MDTLERTQIRLILEHLNAEFIAQCEKSQKAMHADHSAKKTLRSGNTVKVALRLCEEQLQAYVEKAVDSVAAVAQDVDAYNMIAASLAGVIRTCEAHVAQAVQLATSGQGERFASVKREADRLFAASSQHILRTLQLHRFSFIRPSPGTLASLGIAQPAPDAQPPAPRNKGGKPLAAHWDRMWAAMAGKLYDGSLIPKTQADIERAMLDWFAGEKIKIGESTVRARARILWQEIAG